MIKGRLTLDFIFHVFDVFADYRVEFSDSKFTLLLLLQAVSLVDRCGVKMASFSRRNQLDFCSNFRCHVSPLLVIPVKTCSLLL